MRDSIPSGSRRLSTRVTTARRITWYARPIVRDFDNASNRALSSGRGSRRLRRSRSAAEGMAICEIRHALGVARSLSRVSLRSRSLRRMHSSHRSRPGTRSARSMIPMRDGVKLFTIIYSPRDTSRTYPFLMTRTGYGIPPVRRRVSCRARPECRVHGRGLHLRVSGHARAIPIGRRVHPSRAVHQGSGKANESTDTYDTIEWLLKNVPNHNGRVGQYGISLAGWHASMGLIDAHPALRASSPQAPPQDQFLGDDYHSGGAFQLSYAFNWMSSNARARSAPTDAPAQRFDFGTPDGYRFFLELGAAANARTPVPRRGADLERLHDARDLRRGTGSRETCRRTSSTFAPLCWSWPAGSTPRITTGRS